MKNEAMSTSLQVAILDHGGNKPGHVECTLGAGDALTRRHQNEVPA